MTAAQGAPNSPEMRRLIWRMCILSAVLYFMQGLIEPGDGVCGQPVRWLLKSWGHTPSEITGFIAWASVPWAFKLLLGLLVDFRPLFGSRRRSYLLLSVGLCAASTLLLFLLPSRSQFSAVLLLGITILTLAIALSDVATDALMIEFGQPLGLTGRLQSVQWASMFIAGSIAGYLGGWLSTAERQPLAFLFCGLCAAVALITALLIRVPEQPAAARQEFAQSLRILLAECRSPAMLGMAGFLFLASFNPLSQSLLYLHMTQQLGMGEVFYGKTVLYLNIASTLSCIAYGFYCERIPPRWLYHGSILLGMFSTLIYLFMGGQRSTIAVTWFVGFVYQTASMMQLDLAARACPIAIAGTAFALLTAVCNLGSAASTYFGGALYERWLLVHGSRWAFTAILIVGTLLNAACWVFGPSLRRHLK